MITLQLYRKLIIKDLEIERLCCTFYALKYREIINVNIKLNEF